MKKFVEFKSNKFPPYDGEEEKINPGLWGKRLAEYLQEKLPKFGITVTFIGAEDWGWMVELKNQEFPLWIGCGHQGGEDNELLCFVEPSKPFIRNWIRTMETGRLYKLAAFTNSPAGGNPAGVWIGETFPNAGIMQSIAAEVGFSETAFVKPTNGQHCVVRYFSPEIEVPFCGHATIATGVLLGETEGDGTYILKATVGEVPVSVRIRNGVRESSLTSVEPKYVLAQEGLVDEALSILGWRRHHLDPSIRPAKAYAGAWHLVIAVSEADRLAQLEYDFENLKTVMLREDLTTLQLVWRESVGMFYSRNPFPVGGVVEDPATGAAAAALGGYLRSANLIKVPTTINIRQGEAMGRPSRIIVQIPTSGGIAVSGTAVRI